MKKAVLLIGLVSCSLTVMVKGQVHSIVTPDLPHCIGNTKQYKVCIIELKASSLDLDKPNIILDGWVENKYFTPQYYNKKKYVKVLSHFLIDRDSEKKKLTRVMYYDSAGEVIYDSGERMYEPYESQVPRSIGAQVVQEALDDLVLTVAEAELEANKTR